MSKRKPLDKEEARERRNRLVDTAAAAELSLTDGVREMRAISGMTQDDFARHRGVSPRVIKALELGQGNPTVATLNRIGQFFGLEVAFTPIKRTSVAKTIPLRSDAATTSSVMSDIQVKLADMSADEKQRAFVFMTKSGALQELLQAQETSLARMQKISKMIQAELMKMGSAQHELADKSDFPDLTSDETSTRKKRKSNSS